MTEHYDHLQGLRLVPLALCFLGSAAWRAGLLRWLPGSAGSGARVWFVTSVTAALIASIPIGRCYRRWIGHARPHRTRTGAVTLATSFVTFVVLATFPSSQSQVSVAVLFAALVLGYLGCVEHGLRRHYLAVAAACLIFAIAPMAGMASAARSVALDLLIGGGLIVAGVGDHLTLSHVLQTQRGIFDARTP